MRITPSHLRRINFFVVSGFSTAYVFSQSKDVKNVKEKLELKKNGESQSLPPKVLSLIDEVKLEMKLPEDFNIIPFMSSGADVKTIGFPFLKTEIYLAIPEYYVFDEKPDSEFTAVVEDVQIPQNSPEFLPVMNAMSLSREAKKFAIARELFQSQFSIIIPCGILPVLMMGNFNFLSYLLEKKLPKTKFPGQEWVNISHHLNLFMIGTCLYVILYDCFSLFREWMSDIEATKLGKSYINGGLEYYKKLMDRNKIIKKLNEKAPYSEEGDTIKSLFQTGYISLNNRINCLKDIDEGKMRFIWHYMEL